MNERKMPISFFYLFVASLFFHIIFLSSGDVFQFASRGGGVEKKFFLVLLILGLILIFHFPLLFIFF